MCNKLKSLTLMTFSAFSFTCMSGVISATDYDWGSYTLNYVLNQPGDNTFYASSPDDIYVANYWDDFGLDYVRDSLTINGVYDENTNKRSTIDLSNNHGHVFLKRHRKIIILSILYK